MLGLLVVGLAACGAGGGGGPSDLGGVPTTIVLPSTTIGAAAGVPAPATPQTDLPDYASLVATAITPGASISVYATPGAAAPEQVLPAPPVLTGAPPVEIDQVFRVGLATSRRLGAGAASAPEATGEHGMGAGHRRDDHPSVVPNARLAHGAER